MSKKNNIKENTQGQGASVLDFDDDDPLSATSVSKKSLVIFFLIDTSGSMRGTKMGELNTVMEELIPEIRRVGEADTDVKLAVLTFSTDQKLIKLESTGNIELYAKNDIIMHAGHDINASADNDIFIAASHDMQRTADNDIREHAGNDRSTNIDRNDSLSVSENQFIKIGDNKDEQVEHMLQVTAENIRTEAKDQLLEYSTTHHMKAENEMALNSGSKIDIKSGIVKVQ